MGRTERAVEAVARAVAALVSPSLGGGREARDCVALAVRHELVELVRLARASGEAARALPGVIAVARAAGRVALCALGATSSPSVRLEEAYALERRARRATVLAWERELGRTVWRRRKEEVGK